MHIPIREAEVCPGFLPPQAALVTVASGEKGLWVVWCNSGEERLWFIGREILIGMFTDRVMVADINRGEWEWGVVVVL